MPMTSALTKRPRMNMSSRRVAHSIVSAPASGRLRRAIASERRADGRQPGGVRNWRQAG
jgi:hypothetical protein